MRRRLLLTINDKGQISIDHDNLTAAELAVLSVVVHNLANKVLKNGTQGNIPGGGEDGGYSIR